MLGIERQQKIMERLQQANKVYVTELSESFGVTTETIRRDLEKLEKDGLLKRTYGGAVRDGHTNEDLPFLKRSSQNSEFKEIIGQKAASLVNDGDTIMVDSSSTCLSLLRQLENRKGITVITNSVRLLYDFATAPFRLISTGGVLRSHSLALTGPVTKTTLRKYFVDLLVISCKSLDLEKGVMESNEDECSVKQVMLHQAKKKILLADHTKFNKTAFVQICDFSGISTLVTDRAPDAAWQELLAVNDVQLIC